jgi:mRNA-degrading endonuclease RelE of RelBE toxin-antitoxin system
MVFPIRPVGKSPEVSASSRKTPFRGDVKPLQGKTWKGYYRKRAGDYRIIFLVNHDERLVDVSWVLLRSEKTYR